MDKILSEKKVRWWFTLAVLLTLLVGGLIRWAWIPRVQDAQHPSETLISISRSLESLLTSVLVTFLIGLVVTVSSRSLRSAQQNNEIISADQIGSRFDDHHKATSNWYFKGGLGRYFTVKTLPSVIGSNKTGLQFRVFMVDPFNATLCEYVNDHRANKVNARIESLATVVDFFSQVQNHRVKIDLARLSLIDDYSPVRLDLCDAGLLITLDAKAAPAMFHAVGSHFFEATKQELTSGPNSYTNVDLLPLIPKMTEKATKRDQVTETYVTEVLNLFVEEAQAQLKDSSIKLAVSGDEITNVTEVLKKRSNPYA
jgi:hypothetical protein